MMRDSDQIAYRIIITGASSGFGARFAEVLASQCSELVLIARRSEVLKELAHRIMESTPDLHIHLLPCDLADETQRLEIINHINQFEPQSTLLINNAGLGDYGAFENATWDKTNQMIQVNITALTHLSHAFIPTMKQAGGGMINISSLASDLFIPDFAVYAASKAYVTSFSEALRIELRQENIPVLSVCPGPVSTGFGKTARREGFTGNMTPGRDLFDTSIDQVVLDSLKAYRKHRPKVYPGIKITLISYLLHLVPNCLLRKIMSTRPRKVQISEN